jgi:hypothetical protein
MIEHPTPIINPELVENSYGEDADGNRGIRTTEIEDFEILSVYDMEDSRLIDSGIYWSYETIIREKLNSVDLSYDSDSYGAY